MFDKITALYCRYSRDDGQEEENASITHQRKLLKEYAENSGYTNLRCYADDGYSGTNFNRPNFQRMLKDIENGLIGTVIVKDMSRFGRNYIGSLRNVGVVKSICKQVQTAAYQGSNHGISATGGFTSHGYSCRNRVSFVN